VREAEKKGIDVVPISALSTTKVVRTSSIKTADSNAKEN